MGTRIIARISMLAFMGINLEEAVVDIHKKTIQAQYFTVLKMELVDRLKPN